jgi:hypothetical protein
MMRLTGYVKMQLMWQCSCFNNAADGTMPPTGQRHQLEDVANRTMVMATATVTMMAMVTAMAKVTAAATAMRRAWARTKVMETVMVTATAMATAMTTEMAMAMGRRQW